MKNLHTIVKNSMLMQNIPYLNCAHMQTYSCVLPIVSECWHGQNLNTCVYLLMSKYKYMHNTYASKVYACGRNVNKNEKWAVFKQGYNTRQDE